MIGTWNLVRLALRRDRIILPVWIIAIVGITLSTATALEELYPVGQARQQLSLTANTNPAFLAMLGPLRDAHTLGGLLAWRWGLLAALAAGVMSMLLVTRHTRAEEEAGRLELIGSTVVGRHAPLAAAVLTAFGANVLIGGLIVALLLGKGLPAEGAIAFASSITVTGWAFTAVSAFTAQLSENSRTANSMAGAVVAGTYLVRAAGDSAGDSGPTWLTWLSPLGWAEQVHAFAGDRYWVFALPLALVVVLLTTSAVIVTKRDVGLGLLPTRLGSARGAPSLRSPFGLAWRLQRGSLIGWTAGLFLLGVVYGSIAQAVGDMVNDNPLMKKVISAIGGSGGLIDIYLATIFGMIGMISSIYLVQATLRLRSEETSFRAEPLLATPVSRPAWVASHFLFAIVGGALVLGAAGLGVGLTHGLREGDVGGILPRMLGAALAQLPAAWVVAGIALVLFGLFPQLTGVTWGVLGACLVLTMFGPVMKLPQLLMDLSPFTHLPKLPGATWTAEPLLWLVGAALVLVAAGFAGFRRRDLTT
ncbi:ABC transporter permease [Lentzea tibetensis]|uniref:ABC transporter permease n=1 Tax=Lentzea tibetensis TaxID=2591470 RepID=A0A563EFM3_9PSEU|nr:ABC transporter permease [Lentzea tibetensis]TWP44786.1 ABC transporter permease [Lentzea tibetensis]